MGQQERNDRRAAARPQQAQRTGQPRPRPENGTAPSSGARTQRRNKHAMRHPARIALVVVAALLLGVTGYGWATMQGLVSGMTTADVIDSKGGGPKPADGSTDILLAGMDSRTDAQGNPLPKRLVKKLSAGADGEPLNTDTMILLHIPNDTSQAVAISLPRDSYVDIPGFGKHKLNSAYSRAKESARDDLREADVTDKSELERRSDEKGAKKLIESIESLVGVTIDHYASVNLLGFYSITQAVGGVPVCLRDAAQDHYSGADFHAGKQRIAGADALAFVRQRHGLPRGDLDRIRRQQAFMAGLAGKILSKGTLTDTDKLSNLMDAINKSVVLDQDWDILDFAKRMRGLTGGQLKFHTIPVGSLAYQTPTDGTAVQVDPQQVREWVSDLTDDDSDKSSRQSSEGEEKNRKDKANRVDPGKYDVDVRNGNGAGGLASKVSGTLADEGFGEGQVGNTEQQSSTVVQVAAGEQDAGERVAATLPDEGINVRESSSVEQGHVTVLLGADYSPSDSGNAQNQSGDDPSDNSGEQTEKSIDASGIPCVN